MVFIPRFTMTGGPPMVRNYAIAASEEWDVGDVVALNGDRALLELGSAAADALGAALGAVGNTTTGQSDSDELRSYLAALLTGKHEPVAIFTLQTVFETDDENLAGTAAAADVMTVNDLELVSSEWGINTGTSSTGSTPNFKVIDIEETRGTYLVIPEPVNEVVVFQFFDASA